MERSSIVEASEDSCSEMATNSNGSVWSGKDMVRIFNLIFSIYKLNEVAYCKAVVPKLFKICVQQVINETILCTLDCSINTILYKNW